MHSECKTGNISIKAVTGFTHKIKEVERKRRVNKKILFTLFTITEKARKLCKKEGVEVWDRDRINKERKKQGLIPLGI